MPAGGVQRRDDGFRPPRDTAGRCRGSGAAAAPRSPRSAPSAPSHPRTTRWVRSPGNPCPAAPHPSPARSSPSACLCHTAPRSARNGASDRRRRAAAPRRSTGENTLPRNAIRVIPIGPVVTERIDVPPDVAAGGGVTEKSGPAAGSPPPAVPTAPPSAHPVPDARCPPPDTAPAARCATPAGETPPSSRAPPARTARPPSPGTVVANSAGVVTVVASAWRCTVRPHRCSRSNVRVAHRSISDAGHLAVAIGRRIDQHQQPFGAVSAGRRAAILRTDIDGGFVGESGRGGKSHRIPPHSRGRRTRCGGSAEIPRSPPTASRSPPTATVRPASARHRADRRAAERAGGERRAVGVADRLRRLRSVRRCPAPRRPRGRR